MGKVIFGGIILGVLGVLQFALSPYGLMIIFGYLFMASKVKH